LTGLVDGSLAQESEIALSLELMNKIEEMDEAGMTMTAQSGVVVQTIQQRAEAAGLMFPLDFGARGSAMIGGAVSTNAGGNRVIRYGMTRALVLGLEAVLADGTIVSSLNRIIKNNAGYDLKQLFIGSEGTLGIVTRVVLRLLPVPRSHNTALVAVPEFGKLPALLKHLGADLGGALSAFEVMWNDFYRLVTTPPASHRPALAQDYPYYVLVEALGADQEADEEHFESALMRAVEGGLAVDCVVSKTSVEREALWAARDDVEQLGRYRPLFTFDVSLPIADMEAYITEVKARLGEGWPDHRSFIFGHLGDGNLHVIVAVGSREADARRRVEEIVYGALRARRGSISAEHGIGLEKRDYLSWCRTDEEIALMRAIKQALDPKGILNPGKIL
jgi:FAD/FMN-containing dehydrogenase